MISNLRPFPLLGQAHGSGPQGSGGDSFAFGVAIYHFELFFWRVGVVRVRSGALHGTTCVGWGDAAHPIRNHWNKEELIKFLLFIYILFFIYTTDIFYSGFVRNISSNTFDVTVFSLSSDKQSLGGPRFEFLCCYRLPRFNTFIVLFTHFFNDKHLRRYAVTLKFCNVFSTKQD